MKGYMLTMYFNQKIISISKEPEFHKYSVTVSNLSHPPGVIYRWIHKNNLKRYLELKKKAGWKIE